MLMMLMNHKVLILSLLSSASAFVPLTQTAVPSAHAAATISETETGVVVPIQFVDGSPVLSLTFASAQLDMVLSTGSNLNAIHPSVVLQNQFGKKGALKNVPIVSCGMGKFFNGDNIYLGDSILTNSDNKNTFVEAVDAVALPLSPTGQGQLGIPFFSNFWATEFGWNSGLLGCYFQEVPVDQDPSLVKFPLTRHPAEVALVNVDIAGHSINAILATCSPVTIISPQLAGDIQLGEDVFTLKNKLLRDADFVQLRRSVDPVSVRLGDFELGVSHVFVGELPGHDEFLSEADMVLGTDFLGQTKRMILTESSVYFEPQ